MTKKFVVFSIAWILTIWLVPGYTQDTSSIYKRIKDDPQGRAEFERRMLVDPATGKIPENIHLAEIAFAQSSQKKLKSSSGNLRMGAAGQDSWVRRGPHNVGGRTRALAIDKTNENVILAGSISGGMWRSDDGGQSWLKTTLPSQFHNASCVVQDPRPGFSNVWYYGTGELYGNSARAVGAFYRGNGIYKSIDGGNSWAVLGSTVSNPILDNGGDNFAKVGTTTAPGEFSFIWNMIVDPRNGNVYAATYSGIMRSTDGGASWTKVLSILEGKPLSLSSSWGYADIAIIKTGVLYATTSRNAVQPGFFKSTNGTDWTDMTGRVLNAYIYPPQVYLRTVIATCENNPDLVYFLSDISEGTFSINGFSILKHDASKAQESQWEVMKGANYGSPVGTPAQAGYNQIVKIKPDDSNFILIGATNLYRSTDGFRSFVNNATDPERFNWIGGYGRNNDVSIYPGHHPDNHNLVFYPSNPKKVLSSHDGGISVTDDITASPVVWKPLNNGYFTTQAYALAIDEETPGDMRLMAGFQDNGKWTSYSATGDDQWYEELAGGDGCYVAIYPGTTLQRRYTSTQGGTILRFDGKDVRNPDDADGIQPNAAGYRLFVHPFVLNPSNPNTMYYPIAGANSTTIWYNSDLEGVNSGYTFGGTRKNWRELNNSAILKRTTIYDSLYVISALGVSKNVPDIVYYGTTNGTLYRLDNAPSDPIRIEITSEIFPRSANISCIAVDETDHRNVLVVFSNYLVKSLFHTTDAGATWQQVGGNLEENPDGSGNGPSLRWAEILTYPGPDQQLGTPDDTKGYFIGTSVGLYYTENLDGMNTQWVQQSSDLIGNAVVSMIKTRNSDGLVAVATHGDGLFSAFYGSDDLPPILTKEIPDVEAYKNDAPIKSTWLAILLTQTIRPQQ